MPGSDPDVEKSFAGMVIADRYQVGMIIGSGSSGVVYEARDLTANVPVAIKIIGRRAGVHDYRVSREIQLAFSIRHENLVALIDCIVDEDNAFLVYEQVEGGELRQYLQERPTVDFTKSLRIFQQILKGVAALHNLGVVHCDLKPENILLTPDGQVRIADFGVASLLVEATSPVSIESVEDLCESVAFETGVAGTPMYMAPETVDSGIADLKTDIHALGIIAYELFVGGFPFDVSQSVSSLLEEKGSKKPPLPHVLNPQCPKEIGHLCLRMLHPSPETRPESVAAIVEALKPFLSGGYSAGAAAFVDQARMNRISGGKERDRISEGDGIDSPFSLVLKVLRKVLGPFYEALAYPLRVFTLPIGRVWADSPIVAILMLAAIVGGLGYLFMNSQDGASSDSESNAIENLYPGYKSLAGGSKTFVPGKGRAKIIRTLEDAQSSKKELPGSNSETLKEAPKRGALPQFTGDSKVLPRGGGG
jgi:serine/threonine protein kinase